jgi:uncharacterized damage-inducible protein DinB
MNPQNRKLVDDYAALGEKLTSTVAGWSDSEIRRTPPAGAHAEAGKWSVHQILIHLQDAELAFIDRIRRVIAMEKPALLKWDENAFTQRLHYEDQSSADAIALVQIARRQLVRTLVKLDDADFERTGIHSERGPQTVRAIIEMSNWHLNHHLAFVEKKKLLFGK